MSVQRMSAPATLDRKKRDDHLARFAADVQYYLTLQPRQLPSQYLYDDLGSALFEAICRLPWYPITRAEGQLLATHGADVFRHVRPSAIVELGSGSGEKLRTLLDASDAGAASLNIHLVDLSAAALELSARTLARFEQARVTTHNAPYEAGLATAIEALAPIDRLLVLFLGSNIGNFDPPGCDALMRGIRRELRAGDSLLLGADLVKPEAELFLAYDDPLGVSAAFNRNLLIRVNRELGGDFAVDQFAHRAVWNEAASRMEMHLVVQSDQQIHIPGAGIEFAMTADEAIWTESSYKYRTADLNRILDSAGFQFKTQWLDARNRFALTLAEAV